MSGRRVLLVCGEYPPLVGGIASLAQVAARELESRDDVELHLLVPSGSVETAPGRTHSHLVRPGSSIFTAAIHLWNARTLMRTAARRRIDQVLFMDSAARAHAFGSASTLPTAIYVHGTELLAPSPLGELVSRRVALERRALGRAARVLANSRATAALLERAVPGVAVEVLHPCYDPDRTYRPGDHDRSPYPEPAGTLILLTVARLVPRKGHDAVIRALALARDRLGGFRYYIVGDGPARSDLEQLARAQGLGDRVVFTGRVPTAELGAYYHHADLFAMLSRRAQDGIEGFGLTYVEAGLSGTPSVASNRDGAAEAVRHGVTGVTVDPERPAECAAAIVSLARNPDRRQRLAAAARRWAEQRLSPRAFVDRLLDAHR
jgi:phosphatidylinositol alpha-1,6-mannosyltransferase